MKKQIQELLSKILTKTVQLLGGLDGLSDQRKELKDKVGRFKRKQHIKTNLNKFMHGIKIMVEGNMT